MSSVRLRIGDEVIVIAGKDKGKIGKILRFFRGGDVIRVMVSGINIRKKAVKPSPTRSGGIVAMEAFMSISNVAYFDTETGSRSRIGYKFSEDGKKVRFLKVSGRVLG